MNKRILPKVFMWMFLGLLVTFFTAYTVSLNANMLENIYSGCGPWVIFIVEIILAIVLSARIHKLSGPVATCLYLFYTFLTGLTFSFIFLAYEMESIIIIFLVTGIIFGIFALIGKFTNIDLSKISTYLTMGLFAIIIISCINFFLANNTLNIISCIIGIVVFLGYTAYDIQMICKNDLYYNVEERNLAIIWAFSLYLDFINLFMDLLRLFGDSKD